MDEETRDKEVHAGTPAQAKQDSDQEDPAFAATGTQAVLVTKDWPAMSSTTKTEATQQAVEKTTQEASMEVAEDE
eukprot:4782361-Amphidinium_carterae.1